MKVGDKVTFKTGGPDMLVTEIVTRQEVKCCWFDNLNRYRCDWFHQDTLDLQVTK
jgi:uncharacterized protein YodC (DUF2158 family)